MIPLNPSPNAPAITNRPISLWVSRNALIATAWHSEPSSTVRSPPIRSPSAPQNCRDTKAHPSSTDSIIAPRTGVIPTSEQNATRCVDGTDIGMQQQNAARQISVCVRFGCRPKTLRPPAAARAPAPRTGASGARFRNGRNGGITTITTAA